MAAEVEADFPTVTAEAEAPDRMDLPVDRARAEPLQAAEPVVRLLVDSPVAQAGERACPERLARQAALQGVPLALRGMPFARTVT